MNWVNTANGRERIEAVQSKEYCKLFISHLCTTQNMENPNYLRLGHDTLKQVSGILLSISPGTRVSPVLNNTFSWIRIYSFQYCFLKFLTLWPRSFSPFDNARMRLDNMLWWVGLGWIPGDHQGYFITCLLSWLGKREWECNTHG